MIESNTERNCLFCKAPTLKPKIFCNHSCRSRYYNPLRSKVKRLCPHCNKSMSWRSVKHCSIECDRAEKFKQTIERFNRGEITERSTIRKVLIHSFSNKCSVCNIQDWQNQPITFQVDHINGNPTDNSPSNLRLICPNCHSQTETFSGGNKGSGRKSRGISLS